MNSNIYKRKYFKYKNKYLQKVIGGSFAEKADTLEDHLYINLFTLKKSDKKMLRTDDTSDDEDEEYEFNNTLFEELIQNVRLLPDTTCYKKIIFKLNFTSYNSGQKDEIYKIAETKLKHFKEILPHDEICTGDIYDLLTYPKVKFFIGYKENVCDKILSLLDSTLSIYSTCLETFDGESILQDIIKIVEYLKCIFKMKCTDKKDTLEGGGDESYNLYGSLGLEDDIKNMKKDVSDWGTSTVRDLSYRTDLKLRLDDLAESDDKSELDDKIKFITYRRTDEKKLDCRKIDSSRISLKFVSLESVSQNDGLIVVYDFFVDWIITIFKFLEFFTHNSDNVMYKLGSEDTILLILKKLKLVIEFIESMLNTSNMIARDENDTGAGCEWTSQKDFLISRNSILLLVVKKLIILLTIKSRAWYITDDIVNKLIETFKDFFGQQTISTFAEIIYY